MASFHCEGNNAAVDKANKLYRQGLKLVSVHSVKKLIYNIAKKFGVNNTDLPLSLFSLRRLEMWMKGFASVLHSEDRHKFGLTF
jgi:hypothetical protein